jgi:hypothetical protein
VAEPLGYDDNDRAGKKTKSRPKERVLLNLSMSVMITPGNQ